MTVFWYNYCQNHFVVWDLENSRVLLQKSFQNFSKVQGTTNISEGTNILRSYTYIFVLCKFFWEITDCHWIINGKTFFMYGSLKNLQCNIRSASQIVQKFPGELKSQRVVIFCEPWDIGSPLAFSVNEALSFYKKCQNWSCVWDLRN